VRQATLRVISGGPARITATYKNAPLRTVRMELSELTRRTIVASPAADSVRITVRIDDKPWDVALKTLLNANGLEFVEDANGFITIKTFAEWSAPQRLSGGALNPRRVVVAPFANLTSDRSLDGVGQIAAEWITNGLSQLDSLELISSTAAIGEAEFALDAGQAIKTSQVMAQRTRAGTVVSGSYYKVGDSLRIMAQVVDAGSGRVRRSFDPVLISSVDPIAGITLLRDRLMSELSVSREKIAGFRIKPPVYAAYNEYAEALRFVREANYRAARPHLEQALKLDSSFVEAYGYLASAFFNLGDLRAMDSVLTAGLRHTRDASGTERIMAQWMDARLRRDNEGELRAFRAQAARDSTFDAVFLAGWTAVRANHPAEAVKAFRFIDHDERLGNAWAQFWSWYTAALHMTADYRGELDVAARGRRLYPQRTSFASYELRAHAALREIPRIHFVIDSLVAATSDSSLIVGGEMRIVGAELYAHGALDEAGAFLRRAALLFAERAHRQPPSASAWREAANSYYDADLLDSARAIATQRMASDSSADYPGLLGAIAARRGDAAEAQRWIASLDNVTDQYVLSSALVWKARVLALLGRKRDAVSALSAALHSGEVYGVWLHRTRDFASLKDDPAFIDLVRPQP
jgi:TolB-like protein